MIRHADRFSRACRRRYGPTFTLRAFPWGTAVVIAAPEAIEAVFTGDPDVWRAGEGYELLRPLLGDRSLIVLDGDEHLHRRRSLLPAFHGEAIRSHERFIVRTTTAEVARWPMGRAFPVLGRMKALTLEVLLRTVLGLGGAERTGPLSTALTRAVDLRPLLLLMWRWPPLERVGPWRRYQRRLTHARALLREEIALRRTDPDVGERHDVLSLLVAAGEPDDVILDQIGTLLLAGHDTTATALAWTVERLVRHPPALERARDDERYLDAAIKEALRLRPVLPAVVRRLARAQELAGYELPAGTTVMASTRLVQLSPALFDDPLSFRPDRFLGDRRYGYGWIPFGGGTRRCLGASFASFHMRIVLRTVLAQAELHPAMAVGEALRSENITLKPKRGARVVRRPRAPDLLRTSGAVG